MFTYIRYALNYAYNCCFTKHSKVTAHNRNRQIRYIGGDRDGLQEGPTRIRTGRQTSVDVVRLTTRAESEGLSSPKTKQKILVHIYIYTLLGTERTSPGVHDKEALL